MIKLLRSVCMALMRFSNPFLRMSSMAWRSWARVPGRSLVRLLYLGALARVFRWLRVVGEAAVLVLLVLERGAEGRVVHGRHGGSAFGLSFGISFSGGGGPFRGSPLLGPGPGRCGAAPRGPGGYRPRGWPENGPK